jgi:DNA-binding response OmpR family regulator
VVDDEDGVRSLVRDILEARGYAILDTGDPLQALRIAREHPTPISLFLLDVVMPLMKGTELARKLEAIRPEARILFMSAYMLTEVTAAGRPFLAKPFSPNGIATKVRAVLDGHSPFEPPSPL